MKKVALITGASRGIGKAAAIALTKMGGGYNDSDKLSHK